MSSIATCSRSNLPLQSKAKESLSLAERAIEDALVSLWNEIQANKYLVEGLHSIADPEVYKWRYTLLCGLLSVLWFFPDISLDDKKRRSDIAEWLKRDHEHLSTWGEAAIPSLFALQMFLHLSESSEKANRELVRLFDYVITSNQIGGTHALADPYYGFEDVARVLYNLRLTNEALALKDESFAGSSYSAELLLHLMAKNNLKLDCQNELAKLQSAGSQALYPFQSVAILFIKGDRGY